MKAPMRRMIVIGFGIGVEHTILIVERVGIRRHANRLAVDTDFAEAPLFVILKEVPFAGFRP